MYEAHRLVLYRLGTEAGNRFLATYPDLYNLAWPTQMQHARVIALLQRFKDQKISLTDAVNAVIAREVKARVATFDHHYQIMGLEVVQQ